jgi:pimeloyl-ACP methyl ester carboxylesterase
VWRTAAALPFLLVLLLLPARSSAQAPFTLGSFTELRRGPDGGQIWRGVIPGATRKSMIYVPPGFLPERSYPVVYLLHGMPGSPWSYVNSLSLAALSDTLIARKLVAPFVAVVPVAGPSGHYSGEWTGPWEQYLVHRVVRWVDAHLPIDSAAHERTLAGLSAGGYGAIDIGLRHPQLFGRLESWGGYFAPHRDGPLAGAGRPELGAHDPQLLARSEAALLRRLHVRFYLSSGPGHGSVQPRETVSFAHELAGLRLPVRLELLRSGRRQWERQLDAGLRWAEPST